jgi:hypothetical protein
LQTLLRCTGPGLASAVTSADGLPDCLNHERLGAGYLRRCRLPSENVELE